MSKNSGFAKSALNRMRSSLVLSLWNPLLNGFCSDDKSLATGRVFGFAGPPCPIFSSIAFNLHYKSWNSWLIHFNSTLPRDHLRKCMRYIIFVWGWIKTLITFRRSRPICRKTLSWTLPRTCQGVPSEALDHLHLVYFRQPLLRQIPPGPRLNHYRQDLEEQMKGQIWRISYRKRFINFAQPIIIYDEPIFAVIYSDLRRLGHFSS